MKKIIQIPKGFTLLELLIVVVLISILGAITMPGYQSYIRKNRTAVAKSAMMSIMNKQERYFTEQKTYSDDFTKIDIPLVGTKYYSESSYFELRLMACKNHSTNLSNCLRIEAIAQIAGDDDWYYESLGGVMVKKL